PKSTTISDHRERDYARPGRSASPCRSGALCTRRTTWRGHARATHRRSGSRRAARACVAGRPQGARWPEWRRRPTRAGARRRSAYRPGTADRRRRRRLILGGQMPNGYWDRILHVDLTNRTTWTESLGEAFWRRHLGGRSLIAHYLLSGVPVGADPLSPENL